jgi:NitT/TauT family transport system ATP-binding protein
MSQREILQRRKNPQELRALYAENLHWMNAFGSRLIGREGVIAHLAVLWAMPQFQARGPLQEESADIWFVDCNIAVVHTFHSVQGQKSLNDEVLTRRTHSEKIVARNLDRWVIRSEIFVDERDQRERLILRSAKPCDENHPLPCRPSASHGAPDIPTYDEFGPKMTQDSQAKLGSSVPIQLGLRGIRKSFPSAAGQVEVLAGLTFDIQDQDFVSLIGPSGCGKTTIFNIIAGLTAPDDGEMFVKGRIITSMRGRVGYMMQKDLLFPWRTVLGNVMLGLEMKNVPKKQALEIAREHIVTFGLAGFEGSYPDTLSGGMRQRVALIRTLVQDPDMLLLDEPFSALDYQTRIRLEAVLVDAVTRLKKTVVLITHDIDEAVALSKRVVVLSRRPAVVKGIHDIDIAEHSPVASRSDPRFSQYFRMLCNELDIQITLDAA